MRLQGEKVSHQEDVLKLFTTKLISLRLLHPPSSIHSDCKYLFEGIKFKAVLFLSHHSAFTTQFIYVNSVLPQKKKRISSEGWSLIRLLKSIMRITWVFPHTDSERNEREFMVKFHRAVRVTIGGKISKEPRKEIKFFLFGKAEK